MSVKRMSNTPLALDAAGKGCCHRQRIAHSTIGLPLVKHRKPSPYPTQPGNPSSLQPDHSLHYHNVAKMGSMQSSHVHRSTVPGIKLSAVEPINMPPIQIITRRQSVTVPFFTRWHGWDPGSGHHHVHPRSEPPLRPTNYRVSIPGPKRVDW